MGVNAKIIIDEKEINVLRFSFGFSQGVDYKGRPSQRPVFNKLEVVIETRKDVNLADWSFYPNQKKQVELHIYPVVMGSKTRKLHFYDCHLVGWKNDFSSIGSDPMSETLTITCAGVKDPNSTVEYSAYWRETFAKKIKPTTIDKDNEPRIIDFYYVDTGNNRNVELTYGDEAYLVVESKEMIGETVDLKLNKKMIDFMYEGKRIKYNIIKDYLISTDRDKIPVSVIEENNEDLE